MDLESLLNASDSDDDNMEPFEMTLDDILNEEEQSETDTDVVDSRNLPSSSSSSSSSFRTPLEIVMAHELKLVQPSNTINTLHSPLSLKRSYGKYSIRDSIQKNGTMKVETLETISTQLEHNMKDSKGPGGPTSVAIHSKFVAIGTSKGLILVFDHFQNVSNMLKMVKRF